MASRVDVLGVAVFVAAGLHGVHADGADDVVDDQAGIAVPASSHPFVGLLFGGDVAAGRCEAVLRVADRPCCCSSTACSVHAASFAEDALLELNLADFDDADSDLRLPLFEVQLLQLLSITPECWLYAAAIYRL